MSTPQRSTTASDFAPSTVASGSRTTLVASALALGAIGVASVLLWHPWPTRDRFGYGDIAPIRDAMWQAIVIDAIAFCVMAFLFYVINNPIRGRYAQQLESGAIRLPEPSSFRDLKRVCSGRRCSSSTPLARALTQREPCFDARAPVLLFVQHEEEVALEVALRHTARD